MAKNRAKQYLSLARENFKNQENFSENGSKTKSHQHRNIEAFASLNPCPRLIDALI